MAQIKVLNLAFINKLLIKIRKVKKGKIITLTYFKNFKKLLCFPEIYYSIRSLFITLAC